MSEINVNFVANKSKEILSNEYNNAPDIDKQSVIRIMQRTIEEKYEDLSKRFQNKSKPTETE